MAMYPFASEWVKQQAKMSYKWGNVLENTIPPLYLKS